MCLLCRELCSEQPSLFPQFPIYRVFAGASELWKTPIDRAAKTVQAAERKKGNISERHIDSSFPLTCSETGQTPHFLGCLYSGPCLCAEQGQAKYCASRCMRDSLEKVGAPG